MAADLPRNPLEAKYEESRSYLVSGALLNAMIRFLRAQKIIPGEGLEETGTPMGRVLRAKGSGKPTYASTIVPERFKMSGGTWKVRFQPARLWEHSLRNAAQGWDILAGESTLTSTPAPELALAEGENDVWLWYEFTIEGEIGSGFSYVRLGSVIRVVPGP